MNTEFNIEMLNKLYNEIAHYNISKSGSKQLTIILDNLELVEPDKKRTYLESALKSSNIFSHELEKMNNAILKAYDELFIDDEEIPCELTVNDDESHEEPIVQQKIVRDSKWDILRNTLGITDCYQNEEEYIFSGVNKIVSIDLLRLLSGFNNVKYKKDYVPTNKDNVIFNEK